MAILSKGTTFSDGDQLTSDSLNNLVDNSTFASGAVDDSTTQLSSGKIIIKDLGVSTGKLAASAVTTAKITDSNVTKAKIENLADYKVLGNVSGGAAAPAEVAILDEDNMSSNSATSLATQQSIKAYVDTQLTAEDLDFAGDSGSSSVDLDSQTFTIAGATGLDTSASSQTLTIALDFNEISNAAIADGDFIPFVDATDSTTKKEAIADIATLFAGTGLSASSSVLSVDASQTQITSVGTLGAGAISSGFGAIDNGSSAITTTGVGSFGSLDISGDVDVDGTLETDALSIASTVVTATAAELNILDGVTSTAAEINLLDGSTANTVVNSKAVVYGSGGQVAVTSLSGVLANGVTATTQSASDNSTKVATTAYVDAQVATSDALSEVLAVGNTTGSTNIVVSNGQSITTNTIAETTSASGVTVDSLLIKDGGITAAGTSTFAGQTISNLGTVTTANIDGGSIDGTAIGANSASTGVFTTVTASGEIDGGSLDISGDADIDGTLETDALSINGTTVTSTAAELNILDGVTSTAAELNYNDTGASVGTVVASKTVTVDSNKDVSSFRNITLTGELDAATLDISGDADIDGTLEADAITIGGTAIGSLFSPIAGGSDIVTTGALNSGSITSGFGNIDIGSSNLTSTGSVSLGATSFNDNDITNVGSIALDTITNDGPDVTIDSSGDIILDADGAQVRIKDAGTERFIFNTGTAAELDVIGTSVTIHSNTSDADIIFKGNDGGSSVNALTLDMSEAGAATFNDKIIATELDISGNIDVNGTANLDVVDIDGAVDMATTLAVAGNVDFNGDLDVDGTANLDVVDIDGAVDMASTLTVAGDTILNSDLEINVAGSGNTSKAIVINSSGTNFESDGGMIRLLHPSTGSGALTGGFFMKFNANGADKLTVKGNGDLAIAGALSKGSGSFKIPHPLESKKDTHNLVHSFLEGPQADLLYRGRVDLVDGVASVNIDVASDMTDGTFVILCRDIQSFTTNESGWTAVRSSVDGNILTIEAQDNTCTDSISWMVVGERQDEHMYETEWTDENGKVIVEPLIPPPPPPEPEEEEEPTEEE